MSVKGLLRDYLLETSEPVFDALSWLHSEEELVQRLYDAMDGFIVRGRLVLRVWFVKKDAYTGEVLRRELFYITSTKSTHIF